MKIKGIILVLIGAASFGLTPIFVKTGFRQGYSLGEINIIQMIFAFIVLLALSLFKQLSMRGLSRKDVWKVMGTGTSVGLTSVFYYGAMQFLPASLAIILLFQFVWIGMIYEWFFTKIKPTIINFLSLFVTLAGVVLASDIMSGGFFEFPPMGLLLGILSGFSYAAFVFFSGQVATKTHPILRSTLMVTGSLIIILIIFVQDLSTLPVLDGQLWTIGAGVALVGAIIPPLFFAGGAPLISGRLANVLSSVELPVAIVSAMLILSESVSFIQWIGVLLIIAAILINESGEKLTKKL
ncbi:Threonine/homoserine efflux transporter RhtA [Halobacillus dabanensis]|uniref:Threonine/homoserine efflux transporter RhtA n=1 Tax=Halobacillus dabanensis TaxID=240302 RepID=A0A1I3T7X7_HALDA|nr:DMT family transporter [Halobacillus dabanensis]SFJ67065.1 Threonine/homoserine efflux transporter RhtA [Halobacillus dabanensis]